MKHKRSSRLLTVLLGLTVVCLMTAASHHLMNKLIPSWAVCCYALDTILLAIRNPWLPVLSRAIIATFIVPGSGLLLGRLWRTRRFVTGLKMAATNLLPARLDTLCASLGLCHQVVVLTTPTPLAFCFGLLRPRICLSTSLIEALTDKELKAVLLHEDHHRRRYDPLRTLLADGLAAMLFFVPAVVAWRKLFLTSVELAADRRAAQLAGRSSLAGALHKILTLSPTLQLPSPGIGGISGFSITDARIAQLLGDTPPATCFPPCAILTSSLILSLGCVILQVALS